MSVLQRTSRLCDVALRMVATLVPRDIRADWLREWRAEMAHEVWRGARRGTDAALIAATLSSRAGGAFVHALWLRSDRWRFEMFLQDLKYALRTIVRKPGFATVVIATLAVGIGANVAIFSAVQAVLLRPLPFPEPERLVQLYSSRLSVPNSLSELSSPDFADLRAGLPVFAELAAINTGTSALSGDGPAEAVPSASVTGGFFEVLGVRALYGRTLATEDDPIGAPNVAVLGHGLWMRRYGGDPSIVGRTVVVEGAARRVVGVMPSGFSYPLGSELRLVERFTASQLGTQRGAHLASGAYQREMMD